MKKIIYSIVLILCFTVLSSCKQSIIKDEISVSKSNENMITITAIPKLENTKNNVSLVDNTTNINVTPILENSKDDVIFDDGIYDETITGIFGGIDPEDVQKKLGEPIKKIDKSDYERWYFKDGIEIDVVNQNDAFYMLFNYVYISPESDIKTPNGIGIGSSKDDIIKAYGKNVNYEKTTNENIVIGYDDITFVMNNDKVESIFIATGAYTMD